MPLVWCAGSGEPAYFRRWTPEVRPRPCGTTTATSTGKRVQLSFKASKYCGMKNTSKSQQEDPPALTQPSVFQLTPREKAVASHLGDDIKPAEIGKVLGITASTVRGYVQTIYQKIGVRSRHAAVVRLIQHGFQVSQQTPEIGTRPQAQIAIRNPSPSANDGVVLAGPEATLQIAFQKPSNANTVDAGHSLATEMPSLVVQAAHGKRHNKHHKPSGSGPAIRVPSRINEQMARKLGPRLREILERNGEGDVLRGFARLASDAMPVAAAGSLEAAGLSAGSFPISASVSVPRPGKSEAWGQYKQRARETLGPVSDRLHRNAGLRELRESYSAGNLGFSGMPGQVEEVVRDDSIAFLELDMPQCVASLDAAAKDIGLPDFRMTHPTLDGSGVRVAVLDSGVDLEHPWLRVVASGSFVSEPDHVPGRHGTHVAGCIASRDAQYRGVAPGVDLINVRVLDAHGLGMMADLGRGVDFALDAGAALINLSLGWNQRPRWSERGHDHQCSDGQCPVCKAVETAMTVEDGAVAVVAAAGNEHPFCERLRRDGAPHVFPTELICPGHARLALTVGAWSRQTGGVAEFSSRGPSAYGLEKPDLCAPGVHVVSCRPVPRDGVGRPVARPARGDLMSEESGTSMATPIVTGVAAIVLQHLRHNSPGASIPDLRVRLRNWLLSDGVRAIQGTPVEVGRGLISLNNLRTSS